jgi:hypothetical protein
MPQDANLPVQLPNFNIPVLDILSRVLQCRGIIGTREVIAPDDITRCRHYECSISQHGDAFLLPICAK